MESIVYLPMEIKQRELQSRLLIAVHLLKEGVAVVAGQQWSIFSNAPRLPPGLVLVKTVNDIQARLMAKCKAAGHLVAASDEEALICTEEKGFLAVFSEHAARNCDLFLAQSEIHRRIVEQRFGELAGKVRAVGNSRVELLETNRDNYKAEAAALRAEYGPYILVNTNYAQINSIWEGIPQATAIAEQAGLVKPNDPKSAADYAAMLQWEARNRQEMLALLRWAATHVKSHKIVIRPHPGEVSAFWETEFGNCPLVRIEPRSNPYPWIVGADLVIHTTSTTGLEAALLGRPVINLVPAPHPVFPYVTDRVNPTFATWSEAAAAITLLETAGPESLLASNQQYARALAMQFSNYGGERATKQTAAAIVALLREKNAEPSAQPLNFRGGGFRKLERQPLQRDKFTVQPDEFVKELRNASGVASLTRKLNVTMLDDSIFMVCSA